MSYEELLKGSVEEYMTVIYPEMIRRAYPLSCDAFVKETINALHFLRMKPTVYILENLFAESMKGSTKMEEMKLKGVMQMVFSEYQWPRTTG